MGHPENDSPNVCRRCRGVLAGTEHFCPHCGDMLMDGLTCRHHPDREAKGGCVLCGELCCSSCGSSSNGAFLCNGDQTFETMEEMAKVYGNTDNVQAQYVFDCLNRSGLHPFLFSRKFNPPADVSGTFAIPQVYGHTLCEMKVFVPFTEVPRALDILDELEVLEE